MEHYTKKVAEEKQKLAEAEQSAQDVQTEFEAWSYNICVIYLKLIPSFCRLGEAKLKSSVTNSTTLVNPMLLNGTSRQSRKPCKREKSGMSSHLTAH